MGPRGRTWLQGETAGAGCALSTPPLRASSHMSGAWQACRQDHSCDHQSRPSWVRTVLQGKDAPGRRAPACPACDAKLRITLEPLFLVSQLSHVVRHRERSAGLEQRAGDHSWTVPSSWTGHLGLLCDQSCLMTSFPSGLWGKQAVRGETCYTTPSQYFGFSSPT